MREEEDKILLRYNFQNKRKGWNRQDKVKKKIEVRQLEKRQWKLLMFAKQRGKGEGQIEA